MLNLSITALYFVNNNLLKTYGALSVYGSEIPLATYGIMQKFDHIIISIATGMGQGPQPVIGYSYDRGNISRVKEAIRFTMIQGCVIGVVTEAVILLFVRQILWLFGEEGALYNEFGVMCFHTFMSLACLFAVQTTVNSIFMALGKAAKGAILSFVRNAGIPICAGLILCPIIGVEGVLMEGPLALARAFANLPIKRQQILTMLFVEERKPEEIAKLLNCSAQHVYDQRYQALKKLRIALSKGGDES